VIKFGSLPTQFPLRDDFFPEFELAYASTSNLSTAGSPPPGEKCEVPANFLA
jgi:hypothetical protein